MELGRKPWAIPSMVQNFPRQRKSILVILVALSLTVLVTFSVLAKSVNVEVDGKTQKFLTVRNTVGDFLNHTKLSVYPEDLVLPGRETQIKRGMDIYLQRSVPITIKLDGQEIAFRTLSSDVGQALDAAGRKFGFHLKGTDEIEPVRAEAVKSGMEVVVNRSIPFTIVADGSSKKVEMAPRTVKDILTKQQIALGPKDLVSPELDQLVTANTTLKVTRVTEKTVTLQASLPFQVVAKPGDFPVGLPDRIISKGTAGLDEQTVRITYEDGVETDRAILAQKTLRKPTEQIVARGTQTSVSRGGQVINFKRAYSVTATGYSQPGATTSLGVPVARGVVAVDPRVISYYTPMWIDGYGWGKALDTGGAIRGNRIDLYFESQEEALNWGVRQVVVYVQ